jgi:hypothetical protein
MHEASAITGKLKETLCGVLTKVNPPEFLVKHLADTTAMFDKPFFCAILSLV